ncbi:type II toxin-antitoxin system RelE/ParE family toxin [Chlorobaculum sp. MV4-Y]|uniref:type II toxin-antitoxin system RelE/ParE family toxin n=1 Tax=Chlorobaculum sp. MV4-Y TaxID=2976335 RepID=UPI0021AE9741|nr:type II toxin-antitoxin system RelE/ParE family toxin [Chlorobaculum sp. MV4-Y]UWX56842.1 type II toxin-antitoxin system RelE/ParE family toxin [Chlorobaculum sp. MV4-Y]
MMLLVLSCAEAEFAEAVDYYNSQSPGLGYEFAAEVQRTFERIRRFPEAWPVFSMRGRRCFTDQFPFGTLYEVEENTILVAAVMDLRCDPKRWQQRVDDVFGEF